MRLASAQVNSVTTWGQARAAAGDATRAIRQAYDVADAKLAGGALDFLSQLATGSGLGDASKRAAKESLNAVNEALTTEYAKIQGLPATSKIQGSDYAPLRRATLNAFREAFYVLDLGGVVDFSFTNFAKSAVAGIPDGLGKTADIVKNTVEGAGDLASGVLLRTLKGLWPIVVLAVVALVGYALLNRRGV